MGIEQRKYVTVDFTNVQCSFFRNKSDWLYPKALFLLSILFDSIEQVHHTKVDCIYLKIKIGLTVENCLLLTNKI